MLPHHSVAFSIGMHHRMTGPTSVWCDEGEQHTSLRCAAVTSCVRATRSAGIQGPSKRGTAMGGFVLVELCKGSALCNSLRPLHSRC